jgi:hypothetical protein
MQFCAQQEVGKLKLENSTRPDDERFIAQKTRDGAAVLTSAPFGMTVGVG